MISISAGHRTTSLDLLEKFAISPDDLPKRLDDLMSRDNIAEAVIISTCNRTEVFVVAEKFHGAYKDVRDFFSDLSFLPPDEFIDQLDVTHDNEAYEHLFSLAAGIDSVIIGETEILGQVRHAWDQAREYGASGPILNLLFRHSLTVGKRCRTETSISRHVTSVSHGATLLASDRVDVSQSNVLVVGAGSMAKGVANFVRDANCALLSICNRTIQHAETLAGHSARAVPSSDLATELTTCDVAFFATASHDHIVDNDMMQQAMAERNGRPILIIDIAMPRDVCPSVDDFDSVTVLDMDDLSEFTEKGINERKCELPQVQHIIAEELEQFVALQSARSLDPLVIDFRDKVRSDIEENVVISLQGGTALSGDQIDAVREAVRASLGKFAHHPTATLKDAAGTPRGQRLATSLRELFDL